MKKIASLVATILIAVAVFVLPATAHAMSQKDLAGKVFLVDMSNDPSFKPDDGAQNERKLIMFNGNGKRYIINFVNTDGQGNITGFPHFGKENEDEYNKAIKSKKGYYKIDMDLPVKENDYQIKGNKIKMGEDWGTIQQNGPDDYVITWDSNSPSEIGGRAARGEALATDGTPYSQHLTLAKQQYKFKW